MRSTVHSALVSAALGLAASTALAAGTVQVSYVNPDNFTDIGRSPLDRQDSLQQLTRHFEAIAGRYLADGQTLTIDVLDVDLAGDLRPSLRTGQELRVLKGAADWPRITMRYTLQAAGQAARSGEVKLSDLNYLRHTGTVGHGEPLYSEKRMLTRWFATQPFGSGATK